MSMAADLMARWRRDPSMRSSDTAVQEKIAQRLGWLDATGRRALLVHVPQPDAARLRSVFEPLVGTLGS